MTTSFEEQITAAETRAQQMREHAAAIEAAGQAAEHAADYAHLQYLRDTAGKYGDARDKAEARFNDLSAAERLDYGKLFAAFISLKDADARCAALAEDYRLRIGRHEARPVSPIGVEMEYRGTGSGPRFDRITWTETVERVIAERYARATGQHAVELNKRAEDRIAEAGERARTEALTAAEASLADDTGE